MRTSDHAAKRGLSTGAIVGVVALGVVVVLGVAAGIIGLTLIRSTERYTMPNVSMEPTIQAGQTVTVTKVDAGEYKPKRGDVVLFAAPVNWTNKPSDMFIKRVIGLPGERVACCDPKGGLLIGKTPLAEPYLKAGATPGGMQFDITVPHGRLWVMGDNRSQSGDSFQYFKNSNGDINEATLPLSNVIGIVKTPLAAKQFGQRPKVV